MARLIDFLKQRHPTCSARLLKRALEANSCRVNGRIERFASRPLSPHDRVEFLLSSPKLPLSYPILYEDQDLLAIHKPAGAVCTDEEMQQALKKPELYLAHRLDKETTGVLLFAKSLSTAHELHVLFEQRLIHKEYLALVDGVPKQQSGVIRSNLVRKRSYQGQTIWGSSQKGLYAETAWQLCATWTDRALLSCQPKTGRTHQIRVHLAELGHPILIDRQYASLFRSSYKASRPLLHAWKMKFSWRGREISLEAPVPDELSHR